MCMLSQHLVLILLIWCSYYIVALPASLLLCFVFHYGVRLLLLVIAA